MKYIISVLLFLSLVGCLGHDLTSDEKMNKQQEQLSLQAINSVGLPGITKFAEKRMMKTILELRDQETPTYTYIVGMENQLKLLCHSIGFGLPYATQFTNPQKEIYTGAQHYIILPQADPNGLFSPAAAEGTWVMCLNPDTKLATPLYIEPRVIVSPFPLQ